MKDRRVTIFLAFALACALLVPLTDPQFHWVPVVTAIVYVILAIASALDARSRARAIRNHERSLDELDGAESTR